MTLKERFAAISTLHNVSQEWRTRIERWEEERDRMIGELGMAPEVIARETGVPVETIEEGL